MTLPDKNWAKHHDMVNKNLTNLMWQKSNEKLQRNNHNNNKKQHQDHDRVEIYQKHLAVESK